MTTPVFTDGRTQVPGGEVSTVTQRSDGRSWDSNSAPLSVAPFLLLCGNISPVNIGLVVLTGPKMCKYGIALGTVLD